MLYQVRNSNQNHPPFCTIPPITNFSAGIMVTKPCWVGLGRPALNDERRMYMISALLTTLGILLGIVIFFVIIGVGVVEILKGVVKIFKKN